MIASNALKFSGMDLGRVVSGTIFHPPKLTKAQKKKLKAERKRYRVRRNSR